MKKPSFRNRLKRLTIGLSATALIAFSIVVPGIAPFIDTANAAGGTPIDISLGGRQDSFQVLPNTPIDEYYKMASCVGKIENNYALNKANLDKAGFYFPSAEFKNAGVHIGARDRQADNKTINGFRAFIDANLGKKNVSVLTFSQAPTSSGGSQASCGNGTAGSGAKFVLFPVDSFSGDNTKPENPRVWIGWHHTGPFEGAISDGITYMRYTANPGAVGDGKNTAGRLESIKTINKLDKNGKNVSVFADQVSENFVVEGRALTTSGPVVVGNAKSARYIDAATIEVTLVVDGKQYKEKYVDHKWDRLKYYWLTTTEYDPRRPLVYNGNDAAANPLQDYVKSEDRDEFGSTNTIPFIHLVGKDINLSMVSGQTTADFQTGIDGLSGGGAWLYDYDITGTPVNGDPNQVTLPKGEDIKGKLDTTLAQVWFYYSPKAKAATTVFTEGAAGNEEAYMGQYDLAPNGEFAHPRGECATRGSLKINQNVFSRSGTWVLRTENCTTQPVGGFDENGVKVDVITDDAKYQAALDAGVAATGSLPSVDDAGEVVCDASISSPLTWIMCPIASAATFAVESLDNIINSMLNVNGDQYFGTNKAGNATGDKLYEAWKGMRTVAMAIIVIIALFMVIAQAAGWEIMSALTIRKTLPSLVIAIILLAAWWPIGRALIQAGDVATFGIRQLIYAPFGDVAVFKLDGAKGAGGTTAVMALLGSAYVLALGIFATATFAVTAFIAILIGCGILMLRLAVVIALQTTSALFIPFYALPNTRKIWSFFWGGFTKAILLGPVLAGAIAIARVLSGIFFTAAQGQNGLMNVAFIIMAIFLYFGVYAMMAEIVAAVGGLAATLAGRVNDRGRGVFDRLKNTRSKAPGDRYKKFKHGELWNDGLLLNTSGGKRNPFAKFSRGAGALGEGIGLGAKNHFGLGARGQQAAFFHRNGAVDAALRDDPSMLSMLNSSDEGVAVLALGGMTTAGSKEAMEDIDAGRKRANLPLMFDTEEKKNRTMATIAKYRNSEVNVAAAQRIFMANKARALGAGDFTSLENGVARTSHGNKYMQDYTTSDLNWRGSQTRGDLYADHNSVRDPATGELKGYAKQIKTAMGSSFTDEDAIRHGMMLSGAERSDIGALARGHTAVVQQAAETVNFVLDPANNFSDEMRDQAALLGHELMQAKNGQVPGANRNIINAMADAEGIDMSGRSTTPSSGQWALKADPTGLRLTGPELAAKANAWSQETPAGIAGAGPQPPTQPPAAPGTGAPPAGPGAP